MYKTYIYEGGERMISTSPTSHPSEKLSRTSNQNFQGTLHRGNFQYSQVLPASSLVQTHPTRRPQAQLSPKISHEPQLPGYAQLHDDFNYNATPLASLGTQVIIHEKPTVRGTWAPHGMKGWYLGPSTRRPQAQLSPKISHEPQTSRVCTTS